MGAEDLGWFDHEIVVVFRWHASTWPSPHRPQSATGTELLVDFEESLRRRHQTGTDPSVSFPQLFYVVFCSSYMSSFFLSPYCFHGEDSL